MRLYHGQFRQLVRRLLREELESREVTLSDGETAAENSPEHIRDLQAIHAGLVAAKKLHPYGSAHRAAYATADKYLKREIEKRQATGDVVRAPDMGDPEDEVTSDLEEEGEMSPGRTGYGRGAAVTQQDPSIPVRKP